MRRYIWIQTIVTVIIVTVFGWWMFSLGTKAGIEKNTCHSTTEDSELYDCNFDGPSHSWTRK